MLAWLLLGALNLELLVFLSDQFVRGNLVRKWNRCLLKLLDNVQLSRVNPLFVTVISSCLNPPHTTFGLSRNLYSAYRHDIDVAVLPRLHRLVGDYVGLHGVSGGGVSGRLHGAQVLAKSVLLVVWVMQVYVLARVSYFCRRFGGSSSSGGGAQVDVTL